MRLIRPFGLIILLCFSFSTFGQSYAIATDLNQHVAPGELLGKYTYHACRSRGDSSEICIKEADLSSAFIAEHQQLLEEAYRNNNCSAAPIKFKESFTKSCLKKSLEEAQAALKQKYPEYEKRMLETRVTKCLIAQNIPSTTAPDVYTEKARECRKQIEAIDKKNDDEDSSFISDLFMIVGAVAFVAAPFVPITMFAGGPLSAGLAQGAVQFGLNTTGTVAGSIGLALQSIPSDVASPPSDEEKIRGLFALQCFTEKYPNLTDADYAACAKRTENIATLLMPDLDPKKSSDCATRNKDRFQQAIKKKDMQEYQRISSECQKESSNPGSLDIQTIERNKRYLVCANRNMDKIMASVNDESLFGMVNQCIGEAERAEKYDFPALSSDDEKKERKVFDRKGKGVLTLAEKHCKDETALPSYYYYAYSTNIADVFLRLKCGEIEEKLFLGTATKKHKKITEISTMPIRNK